MEKNPQTTKQDGSNGLLILSLVMVCILLVLMELYTNISNELQSSAARMGYIRMLT